MPKRSSRAGRPKKPHPDPATSAYDAVRRLTRTAQDEGVPVQVYVSPQPPDPEPIRVVIATPEPTAAERKAMAAALGRRGGLKGGKSRAAKLSKKRRSEIAKAAAEARWSKKKQ